MILYIWPMAKKMVLPRDVNQRAKAIVDIATGNIEDAPISGNEKKPAAVTLGRSEGLVGRKFRASKLIHYPIVRY